MQRVVVWLVIVGGCVAGECWHPVLATAQAVTIEVDPKDRNLEIRGRLDGSTTAFSGNVRLTANGDVSGLMMLADDLIRSETLGKFTVIDRTNISIAKGIELRKDQPQDVRVTISQVSQAGNYSGKLIFLAPGQPLSEGTEIQLKLNIQRAWQGRKLQIQPEDSPLVIRGTVDQNTSTFNGYVRLTALDGDVGELQLQSSNLKHESKANIFIDRSNIVIAPNTKLASGVQQEVRVTVSNIKQPGKYAGQIQFLLPGEPPDEQYVVPLELNVNAEPDVKAVNENLTIQLVRTGIWNWFELPLARYLFGKSVIRDDENVQLNNETMLPVTVLDGTVVARGEKSGYVVGDELKLNANRKFPANQIDSVPLKIERNHLPADRYTGIIQFKVKDSDKRVNVKLDLSVRDGPLLPLLAVILGILFGRLARSMETPAAKMQVTMLPRFYNLQAKASAVTEHVSSTYVRGRLDQIRRKIDEAKVTEENVSADLDKLEIEIEKLVSLQRLEHALQGFQALRVELAPSITRARAHLKNGEVEQFDTLFGQIKERVERAQQDGAMGDNGSEEIHFVGPALGELQRRFAAVAPLTGIRSIVAKLLAILSGTYLIGADVRFWLFRPLLYFAILILLALLGLQTLYVNAGATFGASGVYDYLGLFLWGVSTDIAQRFAQVQR
jgi:hypothetical protein